MKKSIINFILFLIFSSTFSQNYRCIKTDAITHFKGNNGLISSIRIDSVIQTGTSLDYISYQMIRPLENGNNFNTIKGSSWIGEKFRVEQNGDNVFYNALHEKITIKSSLFLNNSWEMYRSQSNNMIVTAVVSEIKLASFLGLNDSVAIINLSVKDTNGQVIQTSLSGYHLRLSKNYGLISIFNFYIFPFVNQIGADGYYPTSDTLNLIGISNPSVGWQNITTYDIYNWLPGWEFHFSEVNNSGVGPWYNGGSGKQTIRKILSKTFTTDSVNYSVDQCYFERSWDNMGITISENRGRVTIVESYFLHSSLNLLPFEPIIDYDYVTYNLKTENSIMSQVYVFTGLHNDTCGILIYDGGTYITWTTGMGRTYIGDGFNGDQNSGDFVYYKKDTLQWGSPLVCSTLLKSENNNYTVNVNIYPNPNNGIFELEMDDNNLNDVSFSIIDLIGNTVFERNVTQKISIVNIQNFKNGIYAIKIMTNNQIVIKMFVKE